MLPASSVSFNTKTVVLESESTKILIKVTIYTPNDTERHVPEELDKYPAKNNSLGIFTPGSNIMKDPGALITCA